MKEPPPKVQSRAFNGRPFIRGHRLAPLASSHTRQVAYACFRQHVAERVFVREFHGVLRAAKRGAAVKGAGHET